MSPRKILYIVDKSGVGGVTTGGVGVTTGGATLGLLLPPPPPPPLGRQPPSNRETRQITIRRDIEHYRLSKRMSFCCFAAWRRLLLERHDLAAPLR